MSNRIHSNNNYLIPVIYFVLCAAVEPMATLPWQLCKQACYQVGYGRRHVYDSIRKMMAVTGPTELVDRPSEPLNNLNCNVESCKGSTRCHR